MYRIRLHGRGGQGIRTAGRVLASALFEAGFEVQDAPRYGAERRGAPIASYVRAARHRIDERGVIESPDLLLIADTSLTRVAAAGVLDGVLADTITLLNSREPGDVWRERLAMTGTVYSIAGAESGGHVTAALLGAAVRALGVVDATQLATAMRRELIAFGAATVEDNIREALAAYAACPELDGAVHESTLPAVGDTPPPRWVDLPLDAPALAAPDITRAGNSEGSHTGIWRIERPVIDHDVCHRCTWICSTLCPDSAISVQSDRKPLIDYLHCKGCMVCVVVCPPHAIRIVAEPHP